MSSKQPQLVPAPTGFRRSMTDMFEGLDAHEQRALIDRLALLPHQIEHLVRDGLIACEIIGQPRAVAVGD